MAFEFVAVGASLGGFDALKIALGGLHADFPLPIGVVQHRSHEDSDAFTPLLSAHTQLPVVEVEDKEPIKAGSLYVCPPNYHLLVDGDHFALSTDDPVLFARPAIDVFFESAADRFLNGIIGVLLTGMSRDGTAGLKRIKDCGGYALVQDPAAAEGQVMPSAAIASVAVDRVLPLSRIAPFLESLARPQSRKTVVHRENLHAGPGSKYE